METKEEYKGENFDTIEGAWDWHSRSVPETVYSPEELEYLMGEQIMFKKDFEEAATRLLSQFNKPLKNESVPVKSAEEILDNTAANFGGTDFYTMVWEYGTPDEVKLCVLNAMETYASQFKTNPIEVIKNRIKELEDEIVTPNGFQKTWLVQRQKELQNILKLIQ